MQKRDFTIECDSWDPVEPDIDLSFYSGRLAVETSPFLLSLFYNIYSKYNSSL